MHVVGTHFTFWNKIYIHQWKTRLSMNGKMIFNRGEDDLPIKVKIIQGIRCPSIRRIWHYLWNLRLSSVNRKEIILQEESGIIHEGENGREDGSWSGWESFTKRNIQGKDKCLMKVKMIFDQKGRGGDDHPWSGAGFQWEGISKVKTIVD